jgi:hypothetical protein
MEYHLIHCESADRLNKQVESMINAGWEPVEAPSFGLWGSQAVGLCIQAMQRETCPKCKSPRGRCLGYALFQASTAARLSEMVNDALNKGYKLFGSPRAASWDAGGNLFFTQAVAAFHDQECTSCGCSGHSSMESPFSSAPEPSSDYVFGRGLGTRIE